MSKTEVDCFKYLKRSQNIWAVKVVIVNPPVQQSISILFESVPTYWVAEILSKKIEVDRHFKVTQQEKMSFMYLHHKIWSMMKGGKNIYDTFGGPDCMYVPSPPLLLPPRHSIYIRIVSF